MTMTYDQWRVLRAAMDDTFDAKEKSYSQEDMLSFAEFYGGGASDGVLLANLRIWEDEKEGIKNHE